MNKKSVVNKKVSPRTNDLLYFSNNFSRHETFKTIKKNIVETKNFSLVVRLTSNNVFCTLVDLNSKKTVLQLSSGKCNISCSKKLLRYSTKIVLESFLKRCENFLSNSTVTLKFSGPVRMRRFILNSIFYHLRLFEVAQIFFDIKANKAFNGCRPAKQRRKKNKGLRLFK
tara:strand:- start:39 stop:548 length:510 start_codon:yes stop_codon:yes gene_type:complete